jgi:hypothetical protein
MDAADSVTDRPPERTQQPFLLGAVINFGNINNAW